RVADGHRHRPRRRSRPCRGDGRARDGSSERPRRPRDRSGSPGRPGSVGDTRMTPSVVPSPGATVLVVEDDEETRGALVRELTARGYRIVEAPDGGTALARWGARRPDVVLLDLGLPDIDGLQVIRRMRREGTTPIVILSGRYEEREKVEALERGADDYVTKPFGVDELAARLRVALRHAGGPAADSDG